MKQLFLTEHFFANSLYKKAIFLFLMLNAFSVICLSQKKVDLNKIQNSAIFKEALESFNESVLTPSADENRKIYRIFVSSSNQDAYSIRIEKNGNDFSITSKKFNPSSKSKKRKIKTSKLVKISESDWNGVDNLFESVKFFDLPPMGQSSIYDGSDITFSSIKPNTKNVIGITILQGSYLFESVSGNNHNLIYRKQTDLGKELNEIKTLLLKVSKLKIEYHFAFPF